ncbi:MAG: hypothetical protein IPK26_06130 [Planctomycetes bacterium]|nr:hypothetical protein [Planctomycetota bacterium]
MRLPLLATVSLAATLTAQTPYQGNGVGQAYLRHDVARIGGSLDLHLGSAAAPGGLALLCLSGGLGPSFHPLVGQVGLDLSGLVYAAYVLDGQGDARLLANVPNNPSLAALPPLFGLCAALEGSQVSTSKTTRIAWENPDSWSPGGALGFARGAHTVTAIGGGGNDQETRILVTGGGGGTLLVPQASTNVEVWSALTRSSVAGSPMAVERALHQAIRLPNGRVLVCGGANTAGNVTTHAEIWDPATSTWLPAAPMLSPRVGHAATLLDNGKVLVTGGLANYVNPLGQLIAVLNTAQNTGELYDPAANTWTAVPGTMNSRRSGHAQTLLADGRVLITAGISGGGTSIFGTPIPVYTNTCSIYDPASNAFSATGALTTARAFHGASRLGNGQVLVTGGSVVLQIIGLITATDRCELWNNGAFVGVAALPLAVTNHVQITGSDGAARLIGGLSGSFPNFNGTANVWRHDGTAITARRPLGQNPAFPGAPAAPRGAAGAALLHDGSFALLGGTDGQTPLASGFVFID